MRRVRVAGLLFLSFPVTVLGAGALYHEKKRPRMPPHHFHNDVANSTIVITGSTSGIGAAASLSLARFGATLIIGSRDASRREETRSKLLAAGAKDVIALELDMSSVKSVKSFCAAAVEAATETQTGGIDVVLSAAAEIMTAPTLSIDQYDQSFATNHLGLHVLLRQLESSLLRTAASAAAKEHRRRPRVVIIGSRLETKGSNILSVPTLKATHGVKLSKYEPEKKEEEEEVEVHVEEDKAEKEETATAAATKTVQILSPMDRYAATKYGNMLLAQSLYTKWGKNGPMICVLTPGMVNTSLWRNFPLWYRTLTYPLRKIALRTAVEAAQGVVWAVASIEAEEEEEKKNQAAGTDTAGYMYLSDGVLIEPSKAARNEKLASDLFDFCDELMNKDT